MKAWQFVELGQPLTLNEVPEPVAGAGEVVIDVKAAGLCHSDVGYLDGTLTPVLAFHPITLGHEIAGVISSVGGGVSGFAPGDRVVVPAKVEGAGTSLNGGFAVKVASPAEYVIPLPENVPWDQAAAATDAGLTSYRAVIVEGDVTAGSKVGVIGFGGLGSLGAQAALAVGAEVYVAETNEKVHAYARSLGVAEVVSDVSELADKQLDVIVDYAGFGSTTAGAIRAVKQGGRVVQVGLGVAEATIPIQLLVLKQVTVIGSLAGSNEDCAAVLDLVAEGKLSSKLEHVAFEDIASGIGRLERGEVVGRLIASLECHAGIQQTARLVATCEPSADLPLQSKNAPARSVVQPLNPRFVQTSDGVSIASFTDSSAEPPTVVLLHGFAASARTNWMATGWDRALHRAGLHPLAIDLRGHGSSARPHEPSRYTMDRLVLDVHEVLDAHGIVQAHLVGYSLGAVVAWHTAIADGSAVDRLVLGGMPHGRPFAALPVGPLGSWAEGDAVPDGRLETAFARLITRTPDNDPAALVAVLAGLRGTPEITPDRSPDHPILFATGTEDPLFPASELLARAVPHGHFLRLPGRDHGNGYRSPQFRESAIEFLTSSTCTKEEGTA